MKINTNTLIALGIIGYLLLNQNSSQPPVPPTPPPPAVPPQHPQWIGWANAIVSTASNIADLFAEGGAFYGQDPYDIYDATGIYPPASNLAKTNRGWI